MEYELTAKGDLIELIEFQEMQIEKLTRRIEIYKKEIQDLIQAKNTIAKEFIENYGWNAPPNSHI